MLIISFLTFDFIPFTYSVCIFFLVMKLHINSFINTDSASVKVVNFVMGDLMILDNSNEIEEKLWH